MSNALACRKQGKQALVAATIIQKSNMSKHTPGPWEVTDDGYIIESKKCQVGEAYPDFYSYEEAERIDIPYRANARLMAAAPELLEFVRYVAKGIPVGDDPCSLEELEESIDHLEERAKRLVAKIEGDE